ILTPDDGPLPWSNSGICVHRQRVGDRLLQRHRLALVPGRGELALAQGGTRGRDRLLVGLTDVRIRPRRLVGQAVGRAEEPNAGPVRATLGRSDTTGVDPVR